MGNHLGLSLCRPQFQPWCHLFLWDLGQVTTSLSLIRSPIPDCTPLQLVVETT